MYEYEYYSNIPGQDQVERKVDKCAADSTPLIVGGTDARQSEFPHMVTIQQNLFRLSEMQVS